MESEPKIEICTQMYDRETGNHRRRPRRYKFELSFVGDYRRPLQKSGTRRENANVPDSPDLSVTVPGDQEYLRCEDDDDDDDDDGGQQFS